jgi:hypothetical protein
MLHLELKDLSALGADLSMLGFTSDELATALAPAGSTGLTDENEVPELAAAAVSAVGDIWCMGPHRIACGDSTDTGAVTALLGALKPELMVTDPPYGVEYDPGWRHSRGVSQSVRRGKVRNDERADWEAAWALFPGSIAYVWHGALRAIPAAESLKRQSFTIRAQIIWAKERLVIGRGDLSLAARALLVRRPDEGKLDRRQETDDALGHPKRRAGRRNSTQHPETCRVHAAADPEQ